ncbi:MAG: rhomboid family intramembrane serine protease [Bacteroidota bacterium]|nr:rhomboid family intramembrane serine protease [Bacteroidota bacterium]
MRNGGYGGFSAIVSPTIKILVGINVAVFLLDWLVLGMLTYRGIRLDQWIVQLFGLMPIGSEYFFPYWQLITYQFLHGSFWHLFFNMFALWMFGSELDYLWGTRRFLTYYLLAGIGGGVANLIVTNSPTIGASGAVMGILVAYGLTFPDRPVMIFPLFIPIPAKIFVIIYAALDLFSGLTSTDSGIAHFAHLGGAVTGFLLLRFGDRLGIFSFVERLSQARSSSRQPWQREPIEAEYIEVPTSMKPGTKPMFHGASFFYKGEYITEETVDRILEKIAESGFDSLSDREKDILYEVSRRMQQSP